MERIVYETAVSPPPMKIAIDEHVSSRDSQDRKLLILRGAKLIFGRTQFARRSGKIAKFDRAVSSDLSLEPPDRLQGGRLTEALRGKGK